MAYSDLTESQKEKARAASRRWRAANPIAQRLATRRWAKNNPDKYQAIQIRRNHNRTTEYNSQMARIWRQRNPGYSILKKYGLTWNNFKQLAAEQGNRCLICQEEKQLCVDHCHK
jgi:hypothetical protein